MRQGLVDRCFICVNIQYSSGFYKCGLDHKNKIDPNTFIPPDSCEWKRYVDSEGRDMICVWVSEKNMERIGVYNKFSFDKKLTEYIDNVVKDEDERLDTYVRNYYSKIDRWSGV